MACPAVQPAGEGCSAYRTGNGHGCRRSGTPSWTLCLGLTLALTQFGPEAGARVRPPARIRVVISLGGDATE